MASESRRLLFLSNLSATRSAGRREKPIPDSCWVDIQFIKQHRAWKNTSMFGFSLARRAREKRHGSTLTCQEVSSVCLEVTDHLKLHSKKPNTSIYGLRTRSPSQQREHKLLSRPSCAPRRRSDAFGRLISALTSSSLSAMALVPYST